MFSVKDQDSNDLTDFQVYIDGKLKDDKKTYTFGSKLKYIVKKLGYGDSTEKEHTVVDEEPNKIEVQLESPIKSKTIEDLIKKVTKHAGVTK